MAVATRKLQHVCPKCRERLVFPAPEHNNAFIVTCRCGNKIKLRLQKPAEAEIREKQSWDVSCDGEKLCTQTEAEIKVLVRSGQLQAGNFILSASGWWEMLGQTKEFADVCRNLEADPENPTVNLDPKDYAL